MSAARQAVLIGVLLACAVAQQAAGAAVPPKPALRVQAQAPLTVRGTGFRPLERVRLTLSGTLVIRARADATGVFTAVFRGIDADPCEGYALTAAGSKGSVAVLRAPPRDCASSNPG